MEFIHLLMNQLSLREQELDKRHLIHHNSPEVGEISKLIMFFPLVAG